MKHTDIEGWKVSASEDGRYLYISLPGSPGEVHVKNEDEGFVVDIYSDDKHPRCCGTTYAHWAELEPE